MNDERDRIKKHKGQRFLNFHDMCLLRVCSVSMAVSKRLMVMVEVPR